MLDEEIGPEEQPDASKEDPKVVARAMLTERYAEPGIVAEIAEVTGLTTQMIGAIKGQLARQKVIPTKAELKKMKRAEPGPRELEFQKQAEGVPFRRPRPPHVVLERILNEFGVKDRAKDIIVTRCQRMGEMHPSEVQRMLLDLESGTQKKESSYIAEEYYYALGLESERADEYGRSYPMRRGEAIADRGYDTYTYRDRPVTPTGGYDEGGYRQPDRRPWERSRGYGDEQLTMRSLMDILERRDRDLERRRREDEDKRTVGQLTQDIGVIATELQHIKENPPAVAPTGESDYEKMLKHTIERQDDRIGELLNRVDADRTEGKADIKERREYYQGLLDKQEERFKDELDKRGTPRDTSGYSDDALRLAADGMHEVADVFRSRGSPFRIVIDGLGALTGEGRQPPGRERGRPSSVADLVGSEYVEG